MQKLILLRHGQSTYNEKNIFTGWIDIPLTTKGIEQATKAGKTIANEKVDLIVTSKLLRAHNKLQLL